MYMYLFTCLFLFIYEERCLFDVTWKKAKKKKNKCKISGGTKGNGKWR